MRMRLLMGASAALACGMISASGATPLFAANPTRLDPDPNANDAGLLGISFDSGMNVYGAGGDQGHIGSYLEVNSDSDFGGAIDSGGLANINDGFGNRLSGSGSTGHVSDISGAVNLGFDTAMSIAAADDTDDPSSVLGAAGLVN